MIRFQSKQKKIMKRQRYPFWSEWERDSRLSSLRAWKSRIASKSDWSPCKTSPGFCIGSIFTLFAAQFNPPGHYNRTRSCHLSDYQNYNWTRVDSEKLLLFGKGHVCGTPVTYYSWNGLNQRDVSGYQATHCHQKICSKTFETFDFFSCSQWLCGLKSQCGYALA